MTGQSSSRRPPRIVITVGVPARQAEPTLAVRKNALYAGAISRNGGDPILLDAAVSVGQRRETLAGMDGLVLSGGPDVHPARYGVPVRGAQAVEEDRDGLDEEAWTAAFEQGLPVLGICRGLQAINVFLGGRLVQHVGGHVGPPYGHGPPLRHPLRVAPGTGFATILGTADEPLEVNSYHHQAVLRGDLASGLVPTAWASSNLGDLVEAIEMPGRFVLGVQCHPERTESTPPAFENLWSAFVRAAAGRHV